MYTETLSRQTDRQTHTRRQRERTPPLICQNLFAMTCSFKYVTCYHGNRNVCTSRVRRSLENEGNQNSRSWEFERTLIQRLFPLPWPQTTDSVAMVASASLIIRLRRQTVLLRRHTHTAIYVAMVTLVATRSQSPLTNVTGLLLILPSMWRQSLMLA